jgi:hypothetical protein
MIKMVRKDVLSADALWERLVCKIKKGTNFLVPLNFLKQAFTQFLKQLQLFELIC